MMTARMTRMKGADGGASTPTKTSELPEWVLGAYTRMTARVTGSSLVSCPAFGCRARGRVLDVSVLVVFHYLSP